MGRLALVTGSAEPGRDGVGDYTLGLAEEASSRGQAMVVIAIADRHVDSIIKTECGAVTLFRLPYVATWRRRFSIVKQILDEFSPSWVSMQFVPYSFHRRGWVGGLGAGIRQVLLGVDAPSGGEIKRPFHVMFHELWLGAHSASTSEVFSGGRDRTLCIRVIQHTSRN
jgi:hypothetical protein